MKFLKSGCLLLMLLSVYVPASAQLILQDIEVDVLVLYTPAAGEPTAEVLEAFTNWDIAAENSELPVSLNLVGMEVFNHQLNEIEGQSAFDAVVTLSENTHAQSLRQDYGADIVVLFTNNVTGARGAVPQIGPVKNKAYVVVNRSQAIGRNTLIHEIGHVFGARHQIDLDNTPGDAHAHRWTVPGQGSFVSIVYGSSLAGATPVLHFSNPEVDYENTNVPTGITNVSNNTRVINFNAPTVAGFFQPPSDTTDDDTDSAIPPLSVSMNGPSQATEGSLVTFTSQVSGGTGSYTYLWVAYTAIGYYQILSTSPNASLIMPPFDIKVRVSVIDENRNIHKDLRDLSLSTPFNCPTCPDPFAGFNRSVPSGDVYPNPVSDLLHVYADGLIPYQALEIYDLKGRLVMKKKFSQTQLGSPEVDVSTLKAASYFLRIVGPQQTRFFRFVKE